jgi:hypothetical protein
LEQLPTIPEDGVTQGPALFFLNLYTTHELTYRPEGEGPWGQAELRRRLANLGEQRIAMVIVTYETGAHRS